MWEKNLARRALLIGVVLAFAGLTLWQNWPPKGGIDIEGGTELIFEIDDTGLSARQKVDLAETMKTLLQKRVDPKGVYQLTWRVLGTNRIAVQMPLAPREVKQRRKAYQDALGALFERNLTRSSLDSVFAAAPEARSGEIQRVSHGVAALAALIEKAVLSNDAYQAANAAVGRDPQPTSAATTQASQPTTAPTQEDLEMDARDADDDRQDAIDDVIAFNLNPQRFQEALELDDKPWGLSGSALSCS